MHDHFTRILERHEGVGPFEPSMALDVLREIVGPIDEATDPADVSLVVVPFGTAKAAMPYFMVSDNAVAESAYTLCIMFSDGSALLALRNHGIEQEGEVELHLLPEPITVNWKVTNLATGGEVHLVDCRPDDRRGRRFILQEAGPKGRMVEMKAGFSLAWCRDEDAGDFAQQILDEMREMGVKMARKYYDQGRPGTLREMPAALRPARARAMAT